MRTVYTLGILAILMVPIADIWFNPNYELAANLSLTFIAGLVTGFTLLYGLRSRWGANVIGRTFFAKCVFMSLVLWQATVSVWSGFDYPYRGVIRYLVYSLGAVAYVPMLISLYREQRRDRELWRSRDAMLDALLPGTADDDDQPSRDLDRDL